MAKRNHRVTLPLSEEGQISIFFSASLVVMISIVAFVINIGLFVKAKINLQNATDAAAYAGAAVQARQLSKIAYLNWEMRNVYKEWLYKYYVIGNLNLKDVANPENNSGPMRFVMENDVNVLTGDETDDKFNIPAVCIHIAGSKTNICKRYSIPGLPEFGATSLPGAEEASRVFLDTLISTKVNDCIDRTRLNMSVATTWAYNVLSSDMDSSLAGQGPAILSDRQGAWPAAVELALRIRNLEYAVNAPPRPEGVCVAGSTESNLTNCSRTITSIEQESKYGNERIIKAFYSGYRNIGNEDDIEMKQSFTLKELPPTQVLFDNPADNSNVFIPTGKNAKYYLDLKLMMVNYAIFYAAMIPRADSATSGACDISKVAIPVPGYPLGFYKNPELLTYYAVKGEAEFTGMFNPFATNDGVVKMQAYAAAKPFGGRIGPMLFVQRPGDVYLRARTSESKKRSQPYITSYDFTGTKIRNFIYSEDAETNVLKKFVPGLPLPTNSKEPPGSFWIVNDNDVVGGKTANPNEISFGVPNLVYDFQGGDFTAEGRYQTNATNIYKIRSEKGEEKEVGLWSRDQFVKFKGSISLNDVTPDDLLKEIARVRQPTLYEAANYLIPSPVEFNLQNNYDSFGFIQTIDPVRPLGSSRQYQSSIYAPLHGGNGQNDLLYNTSSEVVAEIMNFMKLQEGAMEKYKRALNRAAITIRKQAKQVAGGATGSEPGYIRAAQGVSDLNGLAADNPASWEALVDDNPSSCQSLAGQFLFFFNDKVNSSLVPTTLTGCPTSLVNLLEKYFAGNTTSSGAYYDSTYYRMEFNWPLDGVSTDSITKKFFTAYMPGKYSGVGNDGQYVNPIDAGITDRMRRNFYSTKFIMFDSLRASGLGSYYGANFQISAEGNATSTSSDMANPVFKNTLDSSVATEISSIKY